STGCGRWGWRDGDPRTTRPAPRTPPQCRRTQIDSAPPAPPQRRGGREPMTDHRAFGLATSATVRDLRQAERVVRLMMGTGDISRAGGAIGTAHIHDRRACCYRAAMGIPLSDAALRLVDGKNYAVLATVNPDGSPQTSVVWVGREGGDLM